jgi:hypothetical protein
VRRPFAQQEQERGLGEALDPREDTPTAVVMAPRAWASHLASTCKKHM